MKARSPVKFMDACDVKVTDEKCFAGTHLDQSCGQPDRVSTFASRLKRSPISISNSACEMSLMEGGVPGNFLLVVSKKISGGDHNCEENKEHNTAGYWVGLHSSANEGVRYDALWLALLDEVRQLAAVAPNRLVTDCDGFIER